MMKKTTASDLSKFKTLIGAFMCDPSTNIKSLADLATIFEKCYLKFNEHNDQLNHLRILGFQSDIQEGNWRGDIIISVDKDSGIVTDGIHRSIAYFRCIKNNISKDKLPSIVIRYIDAFSD